MSTLLKYGLMVGIVTILFRLLTKSVAFGSFPIELYASVVAVTFLTVGVYVGFNHKSVKRYLSNVKRSVSRLRKYPNNLHTS